MYFAWLCHTINTYIIYVFTEPFSLTKPSSNRIDSTTTKISQLNIQSLNNNFNKNILEVFLNRHKIDLVILTETWTPLASFSITNFPVKTEQVVVEILGIQTIEENTIQVQPDNNYIPKRWWSDEIERLFRLHYAARSKYYKTRLLTDLTLFYEAQDKLKEAIEKQKRTILEADKNLKNYKLEKKGQSGKIFKFNCKPC